MEEENKQIKEIKIVGQVNVSPENPWRTLGDYRTEQLEAFQRHQMLQEQHKIIINSLRVSTIAAAAAVIAALATCALVFLTHQGIHQKPSEDTINKQENKKVEK